jgi:hypothetical protein
VADPDAAQEQAQRQHGRRGLWVSPTLEGMVAVDGLLDPEAGATLLAALAPLAHPPSAEDERSGAQRRADALAELARRALEGGRLPHTGGVRPQLTVTVELASLLTAEGGLPGGDGGLVGPLPTQTCRRLACDAALCATGCTAAPPTWPTWCCCAAPTIAPSTKAASACTTSPTDDNPPPPERRSTWPRGRPGAARPWPSRPPWHHRRDDRRWLP